MLQVDLWAVFYFLGISLRMHALFKTFLVLGDFSLKTNPFHILSIHVSDQFSFSKRRRPRVINWDSGMWHSFFDFKINPLIVRALCVIFHILWICGDDIYRTIHAVDRRAQWQINVLSNKFIIRKLTKTFSAFKRLVPKIFSYK